MSLGHTPLSRDALSSEPVEGAGGSGNLQPSLYTNTNTFFSATVSASNTLTPSLYDDSDTVYSHVALATYTLSPGIHNEANTFYGPVVTIGQLLSPALYSDADTFYTPTVTPGEVTLSPSLYTDSDTFYTATSLSTYGLTPSLYTDSDTFYTATSLSTYGLTPSLYADSDTFYNATVSASNTLTPSLYTDSDTFYTPNVVNGSQPENRLRYSEQINNSVWTKVNMTVTADTAETTDPLGGNTAEKLNDGTLVGFHYVKQTPSPAVTFTNKQLSFSVSIKAGTIGTAMVIEMDSLTGWAGVQVNPQNGTVTSYTFSGDLGPSTPTCTVVNQGNGWYRYTLTTATCSSSNIWVAVNGVSGSSYTGASSTFYMWGAQLNYGATQAAYALTTGTAIFPVECLPNLFTNDSAYYQQTISNAVTLTPSLFSDSDTFYTHSMGIASGSEIIVTWAKSLDSSVTGYFVYWDTTSHAGGVYTDYANSIDVTGIDSESVRITGLTSGQTYYINISAHGVGGHDGFESELLGEISKVAHAQLIIPSLAINDPVFYVPDVTTGSTSLIAPFLGEPNLFYSALVVQDALPVLPELFVSDNLVYEPVIGYTAYPQNIDFDLFLNGAAFYSPVLELLVGSEILVSWTPSIDPNVTGYYVYWDTTSHAGGVYTDYAFATEISGLTSSSVKLTGLTQGQTYYINISSHGAGGHDGFESGLLGEITQIAAFRLLPSQVVNNPVFYSHSLIPGAITLEPVRHDANNAFFDLTLTIGPIEPVVQNQYANGGGGAFFKKRSKFYQLKKDRENELISENIIDTENDEEEMLIVSLVMATFMNERII